jgi:hypothetical protein
LLQSYGGFIADGAKDCGELCEAAEAIAKLEGDRVSGQRQIKLYAWASRLSATKTELRRRQRHTKQSASFCFTC